MRIGFTYNLRTDEDDESQGELLDPEYVKNIADAIETLGHEVIHLEASRPPHQLVDQIDEAQPDLVFNLAEGVQGELREALLPTLLEFMNIPYTGGGPALMTIGLNKRLSDKVLEMRGVRVPRSYIVDQPDDLRRTDLRPPVIVKPNSEGSSIGIHEDSVYEDPEEAHERALALLDEFPEGLHVEEFVEGREITVPMLAAFPGRLLEPAEQKVAGSEHNILHYEAKNEEAIETICPADLTEEERDAVLELAARAFSTLRTPDFGRADIRLRDNGEPVLIEVNPMPGLRQVSPLIASAEASGLTQVQVVDLILRSAYHRYDLSGEPELATAASEGHE